MERKGVTKNNGPYEELSNHYTLMMPFVYANLMAKTKRGEEYVETTKTLPHKCVGSASWLVLMGASI